MKIRKIHWQAIVVSVLFGGMLAGCGALISGASISTVDWQFVQSVGGIAIGAPVRTEGRVHLPIRCDVSGTETVTVRGTVLNSALVCRPPKVAVRDRCIYLTIRTSLPYGSHGSGRCPDADLGGIVPGDYSVIYLSPDGGQHPLGTAHVPR